MSVTNSEIRRLALVMLDDCDGISDEVYTLLWPMLLATENGDIPSHVDAVDCRYFISEAYAAAELEALEKHDPN